MNRQVSVEVDTILSLISCAEDYGFEDDVLFDAFSTMLNTLSDKEIETYARTVEAEGGYGAEDYIVIKGTLNRFKNKYYKEQRMTVEAYRKERTEYWRNYPARTIKNIKPSENGRARLSDAIKFVKSTGMSMDDVYIGWDISWTSSLLEGAITEYLRKDMKQFDIDRVVKKNRDMGTYRNLIEEYGTLSTEEIEAILEE